SDGHSPPPEVLRRARGLCRQWHDKDAGAAGHVRLLNSVPHTFPLVLQYARNILPVLKGIAPWQRPSSEKVGNFSEISLLCNPQTEVSWHAYQSSEIPQLFGLCPPGGREPRGRCMWYTHGQCRA